MAFRPKATDRFNAILNKFPTQFFTDLERTVFSFIWKHKRLKIAKTILNNKRTIGIITIPAFKMYYRAIVVKTAQNWNKNRHIDQ